MTPQTPKTRDPDIANAITALKRAAKAAQDKARRHGHGVIIYRDGEIVEWLPEYDAQDSKPFRKEDQGAE